MTLRPFLCLLLFLAIPACSPTLPPCTTTPAGDVVYLVGQGWHADIGIPVDELDQNLGFYRELFPGARAVMFGYGKKTFFIAPPATLSEYLLGPVPGPAAIQTVALNVLPSEAYPPQNTLILSLPPGGSKALSAYIWDDLAKDSAGKPQILARSHDPDGLFFAAASEYNLLHTCNTWGAEALHAAGLPLSGDDVMFEHQVMSRGAAVSASQCEGLR